MNDQEIAFKIVRLYFEDIARLGFKRQLDLDQMINAYFYTLNRFKGKDKAIREATERVIREERTITAKEFPGAVKTTTVTTQSVPMVKETTTTTIETKPREKSIAEIMDTK